MTYGPSGGRYWDSPPPRSSGLQSALWMLAALVVVVASGVTIAVVLAGGSGSPQAGGSTPSKSTSAGNSSSGSTSPTSTITAPTTDVLPSNAQSGSCGIDVPPNLVAVEVVTVLGIVKDNSPDTTTQNILRDCASAAVRSRISRLYGLSFGVDYSADLTGGNDKGATARYSVNVEGGVGDLTLTLTRQQDGHYEVTDFTYG